MISLPPAEVGDAFTELFSNTQIENDRCTLCRLCLDVYNIDEISELPFHLWVSATIYDHPRTINGVESFNPYFNNQFYSIHPLTFTQYY